MNYYRFLNESFDNMLAEAQQVVIDFKNIFGADTYDKFKAVKQRLKSPENDISHWVRKFRQEGESAIRELEELLNGGIPKKDVEGRKIPEPANTKVKVAENDDFVVYRVTDVSDEIELAMTKINGFAGAYWCTAGRYAHQDKYDDDGNLIIKKDDIVKVSQAEDFFKRYLTDDYHDYEAYFICMPKNENGQKHKLCFTSNTTCDDWNTWDAKNQLDDDFYDIPEFEHDGFVFSGESSLQEPDEEPGEEDDIEDEGGDDGYPEPAPRADPFVNVDVEDPNSMEFPAGTKEEAAAAFRPGAEIVETVREPDLYIVKWHEEPEAPADGEEPDSGDRYSLFVFHENEGGGPLLTMTGRGFAMQVFRDLDEIREFAGRMAGVDIRNNADDTRDMPECLRESFFFYDDGSWYYDII